jgi:CheY-like chemotaxis protein
MGEDLTVVVVDDDATTVETIVDVLGAEGFRTVAAHDGQQAIDLLRALEGPRVAIVDLMMPCMSGWDLISFLRADPMLASTAIVASTAAEGLAPPPDTVYLAKPFGVEELLNAVTLAIAASNQKQVAAAGVVPEI